METDIKFEHKLEMYSILSNITFCLVSFTSIKNWTDFFLEMVKIESLLTERLVLERLYSIFTSV